MCTYMKPHNIRAYILYVTYYILLTVPLIRNYLFYLRQFTDIYRRCLRQTEAVYDICFIYGEHALAANHLLKILLNYG